MFCERLRPKYKYNCIFSIIVLGIEPRVSKYCPAESLHVSLLDMDTGWALLCHKADFLSLTTGVCYPLLLRQSVAYFIPLCFNFSFHGDNRTAHHMVAENYIRECIQVLRALLSTEPLPHNKFQLIMYMYVKYICISLSLIKDVSFSLGVGMQHSAPGTCAASTTPGWDLSTTNSRSAGVCLLHITQQEGHEFKVTFTCK